MESGVPDRDEQNANSGGASDAQEEAPTRDEHGRFLPGIVQPGAIPWQPGQSGNPGGRPGSLVARIEKFLEDPKEARRQLPIGEDEDLPTALVRAIAEIALDEAQAAGDRIKAIDRFLDRYDGPLKKEIESRLERQTLKEIVVVNVQGRKKGFVPPMPREVLEIEEAEERAERERDERMRELDGNGGA